MGKLANTDGMSLTEAAAHVRTHAQFYRAVLTIADRLDDVDKVNAQLAETEKTLAAKRGELDGVNTQIDDAHAKLEDANGSIDDARTTATEIIAKAKSDAQKLIDKGKGDAQAEADATAATAARSLADVQAKIEAARADLDTVNGQVSDKRKVLADLEAAATDAESRAQKARDFIASLKG
jgi:chromosome segregation ATPase